MDNSRSQKFQLRKKGFHFQQSFTDLQKISQANVLNVLIYCAGP